MKTKIILLASISFLITSCCVNLPKEEEVQKVDSANVDSGLVVIKVDTTKVDTLKK